MSYSDTYRSAFVLAYLLAGAAVGMALLPLAAGWTVVEPHLGETIFICSELVMILAILVVVSRGRYRGWHERWLDYRLAAELVRHLRLVAPLGGDRPFPQVPAHWAGYGRPATTWMAWYVRAVERDLGLPAVTLDKAHVKACAKDLIEVLEGQINYHETNAKRSHRIETKLYVASLVLLGLTLVACVVRLMHGVTGSATWSPQAVGSLIFLCGFLPAMGAALAGISHQGEFRRIARRSEAMQKHLEALRARAEDFLEQLDSASVSPADSTASWDATKLARRAAQLMINEVLDWRVVFLDQPLKPS